MNDRELLELAAKAAGHRIEWVSTRLDDNFTARIRNENPYWFNWPAWNPLTEDGDALRLAVKLRISLMMRGISLSAFDQGETLHIEEWYSGDMANATRRAIVRAAAEIGKKIDALLA